MLLLISIHAESFIDAFVSNKRSQAPIAYAEDWRFVKASKMGFAVPVVQDSGFSEKSPPGR